MIKVTLFGKPGCCLCDKAMDMLKDLSREYPLEITKRDITTDEKLFARYQYLIPVVTLDDKVKFELKISRFRLEKAIKALL